MAKSQFRSTRKVSGRKYQAVRKKRSCELGGLPALTGVGARRTKVKRMRGGSIKQVALSEDTVIVNEGAKSKKVKILSVENNPANIHYTRRNVVTKGCIVKTDKGDVRITSRPGQTGTLFGVFVK